MRYIKCFFLICDLFSKNLINWKKTSTRLRYGIDRMHCIMFIYSCTILQILKITVAEFNRFPYFTSYLNCNIEYRYEQGFKWYIIFCWNLKCMDRHENKFSAPPLQKKCWKQVVVVVFFLILEKPLESMEMEKMPMNGLKWLKQ